MRIQPYLLSLGGGMIMGIVGFTTALMISAFFIGHGQGAVFFSCIVVLGGCLIYGILGLSERLWLIGSVLRYSAWLRRPRSIDLTRVKEFCLIHEGLNTEEGIERCLIQMVDGERVHLALGPFWRRRDLEVFLKEVDARMSGRAHAHLMR